MSYPITVLIVKVELQLSPGTASMISIPRITLLVATMLASWLSLQPSAAQAAPLVLTLVSDTRGTNFDDGTLRYYTDIQVVGNHAHLAWMGYSNTNHPGGLEIYDVSNAAKPTRLGRCEGRAAANAIQVTGHYAYLAGGAAKNLTNDMGWLEIFDVADPVNPARVGGIETPGRGLAVQVAGNFAYVAQSVRWTGSNLLGALEIFDVSIPENPVRLATYDTAGSAAAVEISGDYAYLANGVTDLEVINVSDRLRPKRMGGFNVDETADGCAEYGGPATYIQVAGNLVYSAGSNGLHILDVSTPSDPVRIGGACWLPFSYAFHVSEGRIYTVFWSQFANTFRLSVMEAWGSEGVSQAGDTFLFAWPNSIQTVGRRVYLAAGSLLIYEMTDPPVLSSNAILGGKLILSWNAPAGFRLQRTVSLDDPTWCDVPGSLDRSQIELPIVASNRFFRLARP